MRNPCPVCGGSEVTKAEVLWPGLVAAWELSPDEVAYVNHQQGTKCRDCGTQIRGMALARAILAWMGENGRRPRPSRRRMSHPLPCRTV